MSLDRYILTSRIREIVTFLAILLASFWVAWFLFVRPHTYNCQPAGETIGEVTTLMSNSSKFRRYEVSAFVQLGSGDIIRIKIPTVQDVRAGTKVKLLVSEDADNPERKRYIYVSPQQ